LRRTKAEVGINLPPVLKEDLIVPWKNLSEKMMAEEIHSLLPNQTNVTLSTYSMSELGDELSSRCLLIAMLKARQICILPSLLKRELQNTEYEEVITSSSKLDAVISLIISRKDNGNGKIVFCHFRKEINVIAKRLKKGGYANVAIYDGRNSNTKEGLKILTTATTATATRAADVIILQIQTGCEGLNLQENYSEIYFVSPHWNPCVEDQAIARCHRIGQKKPTHVFKFEMCGFKSESESESESELDEDEEPQTLERYVNKVQLRKRDIINEIIKSV
jgi:SNF2 family DNA or RNA helicase